MLGYIHHIQWSVLSLEKVVTHLTQDWGATTLAARDMETVLRLGSTTMLISEKREEARISSDYPYLQCCHGDPCPHRESVFNIVLEVGDVTEVAKRMVERGSRLLVSPYTVSSGEGSVQFALVTSPCNNVLHGLVNTKHFSGLFLPGFRQVGLERRVESFCPVQSPSPVSVCSPLETLPSLPLCPLPGLD